ncbi:unnamed protein product, partial [Brachionus calyciflorus]
MEAVNSSNVVAVTHPSKLKNHWDSLEKGFKKFRKFLYNTETRECLGRDGLSWAKITFFYFIFYSVLASFFIGYLAIFVTTLPESRPKYVASSSLMSSTQKLNPGIGFRPQVDTEDNLIFYGKNQEYENKLVRNLRIFLDKYYDKKQEVGVKIQNCHLEDLEKLREDFANRNSYCDFDYNEVLEYTSCDPIGDFGYSQGACVALKINKIINWIPKSYENFESFPLDSSLISNNTDILKNNVLISCEGEYGTDRDALRKANINYYSATSKKYGINKIGLVPNYYYPYLNQPGYKSPLVFVHFENIPQNQLILIVCRAYSAN